MACQSSARSRSTIFVPFHAHCSSSRSRVSTKRRWVRSAPLSSARLAAKSLASSTCLYCFSRISGAAREAPAWRGLRSRGDAIVSPAGTWRSLTCPGARVKLRPGGLVVGGVRCQSGGAWARSRGGVCPRTPRLTSALGPGWLRVGSMMFDGVFRQMVLRPLILFWAVPAAVVVAGRQQSCRELTAGHRVLSGFAA